MFLYGPSKTFVRNEPGIRAIWELDRQNYNKAFAEYVDEELKSARPRESFGLAEGIAAVIRSQKFAGQGTEPTAGSADLR